MASRAPIESSPPFKMWWTASTASLRSLHFPALPGSHQQVSGSEPGAQLATGRHLTTFSPSKVGRWAKLMRAFMVPGLCTRSLGMAEVSTVPGRSCEKSCHSKLSLGVPEAMISEERTYWLPTAPFRFSQRGLDGSLGGLSGSNAMWQAPQAMPMRNGGSIDASARWLTFMSGLLGSSESRFVSPSQVPRRPPLTFCHFAASKRGLGNLRKPRAPVEVPNARSQELWASPAAAGSLKSQAGSR